MVILPEWKFIVTRSRIEDTFDGGWWELSFIELMLTLTISLGGRIFTNVLERAR